MRTLLVRLHRWFGLGAAVFLFIAGATGAVISWDHELDAWLNPHLYEASTAGEPLPALELAARVEAADPRVRATFVPVAMEPGHALSLFVQPRVDPATGRLFPVDYNQVALDPATGEIQGRRMWGAASLSRDNLLPFLYKLHYSMHIPAGAGIEWGIWLMGLIGIAWVLDSLVALWISFPPGGAWRRSFAFRRREGGFRFAFDLHRSGGVWLWAFVLLFAVTSVSMNLNREVMRPVVAWFSELSPSPFGSRTPRPPERPVEPAFGMARAIELARVEAARRGWTAPVGGVFLSPEFGLYGVGFFEPGKDHGDVGLGNPWLYFDAVTAEPAGAVVPGTGSAGDIFLQAQFPLHSGRIAGVPGRILVSLLGVMVAAFSVTGVVIWARKRGARGRAAAVRGVPERGPAAGAAAR
jgi:uncharacterized iron-regulated membrane protein